MRISIALTFLLMFCNTVCASDFQKTNTIKLADNYLISSKFLGNQREISISLPKNYEQSHHHYPVIYLLDGSQNLHHAAGTRDVLVRSGDIPPVILVSIKSVERNLDMTPSKLAGDSRSGGASKLLAHIQNEIIPFVDGQFRTNQFRVLVGHSLGGLFNTYALFEQPNLFDGHIIIAPALWWNNEEAITSAKSFFRLDTPLHQRLFFGIGVDDGWGMRMELKRFIEHVKASQRQGLLWKHEEFPGEGHMSVTALTFYHGMKFVFSDLRLPQSLATDFKVDDFLEHEVAIQEKYGSAARQSQETYVSIGFALLEKGDLEAAITVFKRNAEAYASQNYPGNNEWLASAYEQAGKTKQALSEYRKAYELAVAIGDHKKDKYQQKIAELNKIIE